MISRIYFKNFEEPREWGRETERGGGERETKGERERGFPKSKCLYANIGT